MNNPLMSSQPRLRPNNGSKRTIIFGDSSGALAAEIHRPQNSFERSGSAIVFRPGEHSLRKPPQ